MKLWKKFLCCSALMAAASLFAASPETVTVPYRTCDRKPGSVLNADVPEHGNFRVLGADRPAAVSTVYKLFHDNQYLYVGIRAAEPSPENMVRKKDRRDGDSVWHNDAIEFNAIVRGNENRLFKIAVDSTGNVSDAAGKDDNTGLSTFALDFGYESRTEVIGAAVGKECWTLELAIPLGAFNSGSDGKFHPVNFQIGRTRLAGRNAHGQPALEYSASTRTEKVSFSEVRSFAPLELKDFKNDEFVWQLNDTTQKVVRTADGAVCSVRGSVVNRSNKFRIAKVRAVLTDRAGKTAGIAEKALSGHPGKLSDFRLDLPFRNNGEHRLRVEVLNTRGLLLAEAFSTLVLDYQPVAIRFKTPWYRDNIYATMPDITKIEAEILLEEHIGEPLDVKFTGPGGFSRSLHIAKAEKVNPVVFDFVNMPDGDYCLEAGGAKKQMKKLPFSPGEVWIDRTGTFRREGKKYLPLGFFGMPDQLGEGININLTFVSPWRSREQQRAWLDQCEKTGRYAWIYPYHRYPKPYTYDWAPFGHDDMMKASLNEEQKAILRGFVDEIRGHRGFFGHFIGDEPEGRSENPEMFKAVSEYLKEIDPYHPTMLNHYGVDGVRRYLGCADVTGMDCYPDFFKDNKFNMGMELCYGNAKAASDMDRAMLFVPQAFDWGHTNRFGGKSRAPSFDEMRTQMYLALLGNAKGIVFFSYGTIGGSFSNQLRIGDLHVLKEPAAMPEILLEPSDMDAVGASAPIICGVKRLGNEFMIIASNPSANRVDAKISAKFALPEKLAVSGEKRFIRPAGNAFADSFEPFVTHIYLTGGLPADGIDLAAVRAEIRNADNARRKPGNLAAAGELGRAEILEYRKNGVPGAPKITASSTCPVRDPALAYEYFLQDGICENVPATIWPTWSPEASDVRPWIAFDFGKTVKASKVAVWSIIKAEGAPSPVADAHVEIMQNGAWRKVGEITGNTAPTFEIALPAVEFTQLRVVLDKIDRAKAGSRLLSEIEIMR